MAIRKKAKVSLESALKILKEKWGLTPLSHSGDRKWFNLNNGHGVGCILSEDETGNVTFTMCCSKLYGHFNYSTLSASFLKTEAGDLAYERVFRIAKAIEYID